MLRLLGPNNRQISFADESITLVKRNPLFSVENILRDYSWPFTIPVHGNADLLKFMHKPYAQSLQTSIPVRLEADNKVDFIGNLLLERADEHYYRATLESEFNTDVDLTKKLPELFKGEQFSYNYGLQGTPAAMNSDSWPVSKYCWPTWQCEDEYFQSTYLYDEVNPYISGSAIYTSGSGTVALNACFYLPEVITLICEKLGYSVDGNFFQNEELCSLFVWNNNIVTWNTGLISFYYHKMLPDITPIEFFKELRSLGITTEIDHVSKRLTFNAMNSTLANRSIADVTDFADRVYELEFAQDKGLKQDVLFEDNWGSGLYKPDVDLTINHTIAWGYQMDPKGLAPPRTRTIGGINTTFQAGDVVYCEGERAYWLWDADDGQYLYKFDANNLVEGEGELVLPEVKTIGMLKNNLLQYIPKVATEISNVGQLKPFSFKTLFFRGTISGHGGNYAYATNNNVLPTLTTPYYSTIGDLSLVPSDANSISNLLTAPFFSKIAQGKLYSTLLHGKWHNARAFKDSKLLRINSTNYAWKEMERQFSISGELSSKVDLVKI
jgi:hypothetical protein